MRDAHGRFDYRLVRSDLIGGASTLKSLPNTATLLLYSTSLLDWPGFVPGLFFPRIDQFRSRTLHSRDMRRTHGNHEDYWFALNPLRGIPRAMERAGSSGHRITPREFHDEPAFRPACHT